jgi:hypothetical protein
MVYNEKYDYRVLNMPKISLKSVFKVTRFLTYVRLNMMVSVAGKA